MKLNAHWRGLGILMLLLGGTGCHAILPGIGTQHMTVPMSNEMNFSLTSDASITVVGIEDYGKCEVRAFIWLWAPTLAEAKRLVKEQLRLSLVRDGEDFTVAVSKPDIWDIKKHKLSIRYAVILPRRTNINIISTHGDVEVINMDGAFWVEAPRGDGFCMGCGSQGGMGSSNSVRPGGHHP